MVRGHLLWVEFEMVEMAEIGGMVEVSYTSEKGK